MNDDLDLTAAIDEVDRARRQVQKWSGKQVQSSEQKQLLKAIALSWFKSWRPKLEASTASIQLDAADRQFRTILDGTSKSAARATYLNALKEAKKLLVQFRSELLTGPIDAAPSNDRPPDFSPIVADAVMQRILERRWRECETCRSAGAHLAATVMMGGLLEALLVARGNKLQNKSILAKAKSAPIDKATGKTLDIRKWTLGPYLDVAAELGWITQPGKDVATVLRDYRNYVHPEKERVHGVNLNAHDSAMFWELTKSLTRQVLAI